MNTEKTPWNPSKRATARVKNPLPAPEVCKCGGKVELVKNSEIYGREYGEWPWAYFCRDCDSYVGLHPFTNIPLGTLADKETREARKDAKNPFERLFKSGRMTRNEAYQALAKKMGIDVGECHFGWFDIDQCKKAKVLTREIFLGVE